jgi:hypothetical protein
MKFITRELYQGMQVFPRQGDFEAEWSRRCSAYQAHLEAISDQLPTGMRDFSKVTLHDGVIKSSERPDASVLELVVDASRNPWGPRGVFRVRFTGVRMVEGTQTLVGDDWLYEEVHLHPQGRFDYRVLFWKSDFRVVADEVEVKPHAFF